MKLKMLIYLFIVLHHVVKMDCPDKFLECLKIKDTKKRTKKIQCFLKEARLNIFVGFRSIILRSVEKKIIFFDNFRVSLSAKSTKSKEMLLKRVIKKKILILLVERIWVVLKVRTSNITKLEVSRNLIKILKFLEYKLLLKFYHL